VWPIYPTGLGRWDMQRAALNQSAKQWPWVSKVPTAFFRGSRTSEERDNVVLLSRRAPSLVDAGYTKNQAYRGAADLLNGPEANLVKLEDHCQWKYLVNFKGVAASFRHKHLFLCGSLVFHVGDEWYEHYYGALKPWVHYVPIRADSRDLEPLLRFFREHDEVARELAAAGAAVLWNQLRMIDVEDYWETLLARYSNLLRWDVTVSMLPAGMLRCSGDGPCVAD
jgi:protein glucosyltransferase